MPLEHFDVLIIGAGLSGIDAAYHLQKFCREKSYAILEQRERIGGTWDLFRYPGIRSDSDMLTMSYRFRPWTKSTSISPAEDIREYITSTAEEEGIDRQIRFCHRLERASWSSQEARWEIEATRTLPGGIRENVQLSCNFLINCAGYYRYSAGHLPEFRGVERFAGRVVHPQQWPQDLDYANKRVVIIGSGATAVTLLPALAQTAAHVVMLQRSPTYIMSLPQQDRLVSGLAKVLPLAWALRISRLKNIGYQLYVYQLAQHFPNFVKRKIIERVSEAVGPDCDVGRHFTPSYDPWRKRLCFVPDGDLFKAIRDGRASVVTDHIKTFTETGIELESGETVEADVIITATGLAIQAFGGAELRVDGRRVDLANTLAYKGVMLSGVPNIATIFGYTNASWTLKADVICRYICGLLNYMDRKGVRTVEPRSGSETATAPFIENFGSPYLQEALVAGWPKQGSRAPWRVSQNYLRDLWCLRPAAFDDGVLAFSNPLAEQEPVSAAKAKAAHSTY